jgi:class 3 adenylate cyclase/tetratricopeptide (TPR) repeat protein
MSRAEERKLVTVLFADLAGSTELAVRHDPEQLRALLTAYFEEMAQQVRAFGGVVEKYAGDAIMAVFGVPHVHEDDAERAVRAAVAMQESLTLLNPSFEADYGAALELRVGIATGEAVAVTEPNREFMVTGEVPNLASRLQSAALGIVLSPETFRLVRPLVEAEATSPLTLKGFPSPITGHVVRRLRDSASTRGVPGLSSPLVGRDPELTRLHRCATELAQGRGQIVSITGEAGIGKSRLKNELRGHPPPRVRWVEGRCQAFTQHSGYAPIVQILRGIFQLTGAEAPPVSRTKLRVSLRSLVGDKFDGSHPAVAHLLGIEREPAQASAAMDPRAFQSQLVPALHAVIEGVVSREPLILTVEDLHWADAATIEVLTALTELTDFLPFMILVTSRPDSEGGFWDFRFHAQRHYAHRLTELTLAPLPSDQSERLVENLLELADLPADIRARILDQSEGNPFFVEEIIRSLIEQGALRREGERWVSAGNVSRLAMPATLRGLIAARIDRLPAPAKATLQRAAVIGRFVGYPALRALHAGESELDRSLAHLLRAELLREWAHAPERQYIFKHALTQEAAYASILHEQRRALHREAATFLERETAAAPDRAPLLAHHWLRAEDWEKALTYSIEAARRAQALYARPEAIAHYWQALTLLERLPPTAERTRTYADVVLALETLPGWRRTEREREDGFRHLERARQATSELGDDARMARLEGVIAWHRGEEAGLQRALRRAEQARDEEACARISLYYGGHLGQVARYEESLTYIDQGVAALGRLGQVHDQAYEMATSGRCYSSRAGHLAKALDYAMRARALGDGLGDARLKAWRTMEAEPYMYKGLWLDVTRVVEEGLPLAWEIREWPVIFWTSAWGAIAHVKLGQHAEARRLLDRAIPACEAASYTYGWNMIFLQVALADLELAVGNVPAALAAARRAVDIAKESHYRMEQGAALRVLGQACEASGDVAAADDAFRQSVAVLEATQSRPELGQTLLAYGRFGSRDGASAGRVLIERALALFEEMDATGWVAEARAAL